MTEGPLSRPINLLVIHHSASPVKTTVDQIDQWHREKFINGIGYHHVIRGDGILWEGRDLAVAGAHAKGHNTHSLGLCLTGNNCLAEQEWTTAQKNQLALYVRWFRTFFPHADILGHRDLPGAKTLCPGLDVRKLLHELGALGG